MIQIVKDPTSEIARLAKGGSGTLKRLRQENDANQMREKFWELAGSKLGDLLKI
jgi:pre-mRNA-splicing factor ATP-dependent RNA helicase DHX38/PRP16